MLSDGAKPKSSIRQPRADLLYRPALRVASDLYPVSLRYRPDGVDDLPGSSPAAIEPAVFFPGLSKLPQDRDDNRRLRYGQLRGDRGRVDIRADFRRRELATEAVVVLQEHKRGRERPRLDGQGVVLRLHHELDPLRLVGGRVRASEDAANHLRFE